MATLVPLHTEAQDRNEKEEKKEERHIAELFYRNEDKVSEKTLDKVSDPKTLVGQVISLRPDYNYHKTHRNFDFVTTKTNVLTNISLYDKNSVTSDDALAVVKAKKDELTLTIGEKKVTLQKADFGNFMLRSDMEAFVQAFLQQEEDVRQEELRLKQQAEEQAAQEKAEAEEGRRKENLEQYRENLKKMPTVQSGPIAVDVPERAYDGTIPYWKWISRNGSGKLDTYRDEKFVLSPQRFPQACASLKEKMERNPNSTEYKHLILLETMQTDTFGIFNWQSFINLRTGDVFSAEREDKIMKMWESVNYLENIKSIGAYTYDGTISLQEAVYEVNASIPYGERVLEALIGEKVFFLDSLKYDIITGYEEELNSSNPVAMTFKERGKKRYDWKDKCISVKWYEQLQKMVGQKTLLTDELSFNEYHRVWREDIPNKESYTIDKFEVKDKELHMILSHNGETENINAIEYCGLLAYPINTEEEWESKQVTGQSRLDRRNYISYEAVISTTPKKPADVKKQEAENKARWAAAAEKMNLLRQHKLIGTSLTSFLQEWPSAQLLRTTTIDGVTVKVYCIYDYQLTFRNGVCVSQTSF